jgi:hypothetical protein
VAALALQNLTIPGVTGLDPAFTVAVSVTGVGQGTDVADTLSVVVDDAAQLSAAATISNRRNKRTLDISLSV